MSGSRRRGRRGGAGTAGGIDFQSRLAAALACAVLAEREASPPWEWPETASLTSVYAETGEEADDLFVSSSAGGRAYVQAKVRLQLGKTAGSEFASTLGQFVRQFLAARDRDNGQHPLTRDDRLVLAVGPESSSRIRDDLPRVLERIRGLPTDRALAGAAGTSSEEELLSVLTRHIQSAWLEETGSEATDAEIRELLALVRVSVHDLTDDGAATREAKNFLRATVLRDADTAGQVWGAIVALTARFSADQSGADRSRLEQLLSDRGVVLRSAPSFRNDIEKLRAHSERTMRRLKSFSHMWLGDDRYAKIDRAVPEEIRKTVEDNSTLITGEPGAGKSASVYELLVGLHQDQRDVVALAADTLSAESLGELRDELKLDHDVADVLKNWPGTEPAFLVIDALDAARGDRTQEALLDLIGETSAQAPRWRIGASIRRFDLRYNRKLRELFSVAVVGASVTGYELPEFASVRHFSVPLLTTEELELLSGQAPALHELLSGASSNLRDLARVPFNLRLLAELLGLEVSGEEIEPITTQLQLLDKYWDHRVLGTTATGDSLEALLRNACENMIASRTLRVNRSELQGDPDALQTVLSGNVLSEQESPQGTPEREVLTFSHHVLFDYAVERLLFRGTAERLTQRLAREPELLLVVRPSIDLHFRYLWELDGTRERFWELVLALFRENDVPDIGKIIGPTVAADLLRAVDDVRPLVEALRADDELSRKAAEQALEHLVGALFASGLTDSQRPVWCEVASGVSGVLRRETAYPLRSLLMELSDNAARLSDEEASHVGTAARRLLEFAWNTESPDRNLAIPGIEAVARTFPSDPAESARLLRRVLEPERLAEVGFIEMPELAGEVEGLIDHDPELVREIYVAAFDFEETSDAATHMRGGVMPLSSNRRQDYEMAHYVLAEKFPTFLELAPPHAIAALASVRMSYARHQASGDFKGSSLAIPWGDQEAQIEEDGSYIWDANPHEHDDEVKILNAFEHRLNELAESGVAAPLGEFVGHLIGPPIPASMWRRLLMAGARQPEAFGPLLEPLTTSRDVMMSRELSTVLGEFLRAAFTLFEPEHRERIERAILEIPDHYGTAHPNLAAKQMDREFGEQARDRLLGCLPTGALVTDETKARLAELEAHDAVPDNAPPVGPLEFGWSKYGEREELAEEGVDVDAEPNVRLQALATGVRAFADQYQNGSPSMEEIEAIYRPLLDLWAGVKSAQDDGADERQRDFAWGTAADAAEAVSRAKELSCDQPVVALAREILIDSVTHHLPLRNEESDARFDENPSWGSPAPRVEAAVGLMNLAVNQDCLSEEAIGAIKELSQDAVPAVRFQIARRLCLMRVTSPQLMTQICDRLVESDPSFAVLNALLVDLVRMQFTDDRAREIIESLYARATVDAPGASDVRDSCVQLMTDMYVWRGDGAAHEFLEREVLGDIGAHPEEARQIAIRLRRAQTHGGPEREHTAIRARAFELLSSLLDAAIPLYHEAVGALEGRQGVDDSDPDLQHARGIAQAIDTVGAEVYFASGAFDDRQAREPQVSRDQRERFCHEAADVLDKLADVPVPQVVHHVLETLEVLVEFDPPAVFRRIARAIRGGEAAGYQFDSLAADLFVRLIERYLAEHRAMLQRDAEARALLIEILDVFVRAGWPKARRLTYGLHELFR